MPLGRNPLHPLSHSHAIKATAPHEPRPGQTVGKRQRTGALHEAVARARAPRPRVSVLDCASPLALFVAVQEFKTRNWFSANSTRIFHETRNSPNDHCSRGSSPGGRLHTTEDFSATIGQPTQHDLLAIAGVELPPAPSEPSRNGTGLRGWWAGRRLHQLQVTR